MAHVTTSRKWLAGIAVFGFLLGIGWWFVDTFWNWDTFRGIALHFVFLVPIVSTAALVAIKPFAKFLEEFGLTPVAKSTVITIGLLFFFGYIGYQGYMRRGFFAEFLGVTVLEAALIMVSVGLILFPIPVVILSLFQSANLPVSPESVSRGTRMVGAIIAIFLIIRGVSVEDWPGQSRLLGATLSEWTSPTLLASGSFPDNISPQFVDSDCQSPPDGATDARFPSSQRKESTRDPEDDHWVIYWTGDEAEGFRLITPEMGAVVRAKADNPRDVSKGLARLEVWSGPENHLDQSGFEFTTRTSREWGHGTIPLDTRRNYNRQSGCLYCSQVTYPNPQLMDDMGPEQSALVLGSMTNPDALRTFHEIIREQNGVVEFVFDLDNPQAYLYLMHWAHEYVGWFGHQARFKLFLSPHE